VLTDGQRISVINAPAGSGKTRVIADAAAAACVALTLDGADTLLMVAGHSLRRKLSRRVRDDLIRLGIVQACPKARGAPWRVPADTGDQGRS
jgi:superfamily I DNA/RNA helicase